MRKLWREQMRRRKRTKAGAPPPKTDAPPPETSCNPDGNPNATDSFLVTSSPPDGKETEFSLEMTVLSDGKPNETDSSAEMSSQSDGQAGPSVEPKAMKMKADEAVTWNRVLETVLGYLEQRKKAEVREREGV
jgi:hypothetical protein